MTPAPSGLRWTNTLAYVEPPAKIAPRASEVATQLYEDSAGF